MIKRIVLVAVCSVFGIASAHAQTCLGGLAFKDAPTHVGGLFTTSSDSHTFSGGVSREIHAYLVNGAVSYLSLDGISATGIEGLAGTEIHLQANPKLSVCPIVIVNKVFGPSPSPDVTLGELTLSFGGMVGFNAMTSGTTRVVPTFGLLYNHLHESQSGTDAFGGAAAGSFGESSASLQLGVGFIFNERMSLIPVFIVPFGSDVAENVFSVTFSMNLP